MRVRRAFTTCFGNIRKAGLYVCSVILQGDCERKNCKTIPPGQAKKGADRRRASVKARAKNLKKKKFKGQDRGAEAEAERLAKKTLTVKSAQLEILGINSDIVSCQFR